MKFYRLSTQDVPAGPIRQPIMGPAPIYQSQPNYYSSMPQQTTQIVPYNPSAQTNQIYPQLPVVHQPTPPPVPASDPQRKTPLTPNELQRLYSLSNQQNQQLVARSPYAAAAVLPVPQYAMPQYGHYGMQYAATSLNPPIIGGPQIVAPALPPRNSTTQIYNQAPPAVPPRNSLPNIPVVAVAAVPSTSVSIVPSIASSLSSASVKYEDVQLRPKKSKDYSRNLGGDLIDLDNGMDE